MIFVLFLRLEFLWCDAVTMVADAQTALDMLRERKDGTSSTYMPKMDGFKLLELIGLEMDLPVISKALAQTHFPHFYAWHSSDRADCRE